MARSNCKLISGKHWMFLYFCHLLAERFVRPLVVLPKYAVMAKEMP